MPRTKNIRPTIIYFLLDTRPEKMAEWPQGEPFYCGKTVEDTAEQRLSAHKYKARMHPNRKNSKRLLECGEHVRTLVMEIVPPDRDWVARERHWIKMIRFSFPGATNVSDGGDGAPGYVASEETRAKLSAMKKGRTLSAEHRAKIGAACRGKKLPPRSPEYRAKSSAARKGKKRGPHSPEHRAKLSEAHKARFAQVAKTLPPH